MANPKAQTKDDIAWRNFPQIEKAFSDSGPALMEKVEKTCRRLDEFRVNGTTQEKTRAAAGLAAYGRTLELLKQLREMREKAAASAAASK